MKQNELFDGLEFIPKDEGSLDAAPFWYWINERHRIYLKKEAGETNLTDDPILQEYRFCNVFRELDRVTKWIRQNWREPYKNHENLWFAMAIARQINWPATLDEIGFPDGNMWELRENAERAIQLMSNILDVRKSRGDKVYTGAYMIRAESDTNKPWYSWTKQQYMAKIVLGRVFEAQDKFYNMWNCGDEFKLGLAQPTLQEVHQWFMQFHGWGEFMSYEVVTDLRHTRYLENAPDIMTWANAGPGAKRGLNRLFNRPLDAPMSQKLANEEMKYLLKLSQRPGNLEEHVPALEMRDIEHSLCETDKYLRVLNGEGRPRAKYVHGRGY